ncbi:ubiquitin ligase e3, partial [Chrysochromulina tobinii]
MPFKQALLQHVIRHYPAFILQAASVALTDSKTSVAPKDSGSTTFGKFTVQFKGNLVVTMVTDGLLGMLLDTLHSLLLEAARAEGGVMLEEGEDEEAAEEEADIELGSDELLGHAVSSRDEADEPADEPVALSPNGAVDVGWRLADVAGGPSEMMDVEASPLAGSASGVGGVRNLVERYEWTAAEDELTLGSVEEYGSKWTSTLVAAAAMEKAGELLEAAELVVSAKSPIVSSHLYSQVCYDVRYTLNHLPLADAFMRRGELLPLLLRCLSLCQGLYPIRRRTQMHVVREENTWADAFSLGTEMSQLFPHVVAGIAAPETDPDASAKIGLALSLPCATPARAQVAARYVAAVTHTTRSLRAWLLCHRAARLGCDGTRGLFSYHLPLHRLLATLVSFGAHTLQLPLDSLLPPCLDGAVPLKEDFILRLAKHPLRVLTLLSQTRSSYWVRNGHAASKPATLYRSPTFGELFMMPDLMLLQYCLLRLGTARFVGLGLATFALRSFLPGLVSASQPPLAYPAVDHSDRPLAPGVAPGDPTPLAEDFLTLLVMLVNERSPCASADAPPAPPSVVLERQLIHRLALSEHCTYSELINALPKRLTELPEFEESLHRIANFVAPTGMAQGRYVLRKEAWSRFDAFFPLYSPQDVHRAQERAARFVPSDAPLPTPPPPCAAFERLPHALSCASVHGILYAVLYAAVRR